jgi:amidohydrolase
VRDGLPPGRIHVLGTPAEEGGGGKVRLLRGGAFEGVDAALMVHGLDRWVAHADLLGITRIGFEFTGRAAHAAADPWAGVNALDAVIQTFNAVSMLRQQVRPDCRIHGIVTSGGAAPNIIPEFAAATFYVRAPRLDVVAELKRRVIACAEGAAQATGCTVKVVENEGTDYEPFRRNDALLGLYRANLGRLGVEEAPAQSERVGSSDVGNVSQVVPTIQPYVKVAPEGTPIHSRDFEAAAAGPLAREGFVLAAKALAMTAYDLLADPGHLVAARREWEAR